MYFLQTTADMLKSPIFFFFKGNNQLSTKPGFLLSMGLFVLILNIALQSDFFHQTKPNISLQTDYNERYGRMAFDRSNFTIITKVADFYGVYQVDYSYFYFNMTFNHFDIGAEIAVINTQFMRMCEPKDFTEEELTLNLSNKSFCIGHEEPMVLKGSLTSSSVDYAILSFNRCDKYSEAFFNTKCKNKTEINDFLRNKFLYLYYTENKFDLTKLENPINRDLTCTLLYIYPEVKKTSAVSVQKTLIQSDLGFLHFFIFSRFF